MVGFAPPIVTIYEGFFVFRISPQTIRGSRENVDSSEDCLGSCHDLDRHDRDGSRYSKGQG